MASGPQVGDRARAGGGLRPPIETVTLTDGGQSAADVADRLIPWLEAAERSLDLALYDVRLPGAVGDAVGDALRAAARRGVRVRIAYNGEDDGRRKPLPPPARTEPPLLERLGVPLRAIPGVPDLMHHKYVVRDGTAVLTGSTNWTLDSWTREENVIVTVESAQLAHAYARDFAQLWERGDVDGTGGFDVPPIGVGDATVRAWFCPGRGPELAARVAKRVAQARRRVRIASPVLTSAPLLATLGETLAERRVDVVGVVDGTQVEQVFEQWRDNPASRWKGPLLGRVLEGFAFSGKRSTPYAPGAVHDYMHAKVVVADDVVFAGSYNLSRSGEDNAENVLEIRAPELADELAAFVEAVARAHPPVDLPRGY
ncbi:MAG TPA: phospholipase D-like domain-containing protein [Solirubrobacteraceae bacterium]|nr:phospholipase D-like domain-containing protein [Solirubrobacteraceae bacterium]